MQPHLDVVAGKAKELGGATLAQLSEEGMFTQAALVNAYNDTRACLAAADGWFVVATVIGDIPCMDLITLDVRANQQGRPASPPQRPRRT